MLSSLASHSLILTATKRLAVELVQHCPKNTQVFHFNQWLIHLWAQNKVKAPKPTLLTPHQSLTLWHDVINNDPQSFMMPPFSTAKLAAKAYHLLKHWEIDLKTLQTHPHPDVYTFAKWAAQYEAHLRKHTLIDENELCEALMHSECSQNDSPVTSSCTPTERLKTITLAGFDKLTPLQQIFLNKMNVEVVMLDVPSQNQQCHQLACDSTESEIKYAAHHFKHELQKHPEHTFALIAPNLAAIRSKIASIFHDIVPANIAGGEALYHFPLIRAAFNLLELHGGWLDIQHLSVLLNSPFLNGAESEWINRAELDAIVREHAETRVTLRQTLRFAREKNTPHYSPKWVQCVEEAATAFKKWPKAAAPSHWIEHFSNVLEAFGWPGERECNDEEAQLQTTFNEVLTTFGELDMVLGELPADEAVHHLTELAHQSVFHKDNEKARVHVLGMLEATGLSFDQVWVMGLNDSTFPQAPAPHPFLPFALQRERQIPHADAEREFKFAETILKRCINSGSQSIVSYSLFENDQALRPSVFLSDFPETTIETVGLKRSLTLNGAPGMALSSPRRRGSSHYSVDEEPDDYGPALQKAETGITTIRGGSGVLQSQAQCPFQAFARYRLNATSLHTPEPGITPAERGTLVHSALAYFWNQVGSQRTLLTLSDETLEKHIEECVDHALNALRALRPLALQKTFSSIEYKRLNITLNQLINIEKTRSPFKVVSTEEKHHATFGPYHLSLRIDRIDEIEIPNGETHTWVIDYKTGNMPLSNWLNERLTDPQLPLYAVTSSKQIDGIIIGTVKANTVEYKGLTHHKTPLKKVKQCDDWDERLNTWKQQIEELIAEFTSGYAAIKPYTPASCLYCEFHSLCRINEQNQ